ncbi:MAG: TlpA family protein disulfide reductase [Lewinellaceae bacterium]|nr:TlpA family protein disulfide reductase [Lewinellaceae bacterium]
MLKNWFVVFLISGCFLNAHAAFVSGVFKNAAPGSVVQIYVPHYYVDGRADTYWAELDDQLRVSIEAIVPEPQLAFLICNEERLPVFLEPVDTLYVKTDMFQFPMAVAFTGRGGANNRLLLQYFQENPPDFNEMNNIRFKIGQWWAVVEQLMNDRMESLGPTEFRDYMDRRKTAASMLLDDFSGRAPAALTPAFYDWMAAEIVYYWAYHLLFYGQVYGNRHQVQPEFFDFLSDAALISESVGNDWYRLFLQALLARQQAAAGSTDNFYIGQYNMAGTMLSGKSMAFFRSEMIRLAFSGDRYREILPYYTDFLKTNEYTAYDAKVTDLYEKIARVSPGIAAPVFTGEDAEGRVLALSQFRGKVVYLNFWASWCSACLLKMDMFNDFAAELNRSGIEIVNISIDDNPAAWQRALAERNFKGHNLLASSGRERNIAQSYGVEAVPQYFIVGKDGTFAVKATSNQPGDINTQLLNLSRQH